ncbi:MAG: gliding motility-associated C-terminal domain-containing protein [Chitinophagales bacterium]
MLRKAFRKLTRQFRVAIRCIPFNLTINYASPTTTINNTTCDANLVGTNTTTFSNVNGCDSVVITNTTLLPAAYGAVSVSGCDSALANGTWYYASTSFNDTLNNQAANGCDSIVTYTVSVSNSVFSVDTSWVCGNEDSTLYVSHFTAQNGCDSTYYHLVFSINQTDSTFLTSTTCQAENAGIFTDTFTNVYGCDSVVIENIAYQPFEVLVNASDTIIYKGNEVILYSEGENTTSYYWTVNNNAVSTDSSFADYPTETVTYYLLASDGICDGMDSITIQVLLENTPLIPNSFTPNGDILNDIFRVVNADKYSNITMKIYNRWGAEVYYGSGSNPGWDGTFKLENQPIDNYNYVIVLESFSGKITTITGSLALFR